MFYSEKLVAFVITVAFTFWFLIHRQQLQIVDGSEYLSFMTGWAELGGDLSLKPIQSFEIFLGMYFGASLLREITELFVHTQRNKAWTRALYVYFVDFWNLLVAPHIIIHAVIFIWYTYAKLSFPCAHSFLSLACSLLARLRARALCHDTWRAVMECFQQDWAEIVSFFVGLAFRIYCYRRGPLGRRHDTGDDPETCLVSESTEEHKSTAHAEVWARWTMA